MSKYLVTGGDIRTRSYYPPEILVDDDIIDNDALLKDTIPEHLLVPGAIVYTAGFKKKKSLSLNNEWVDIEPDSGGSGPGAVESVNGMTGVVTVKTPIYLAYDSTTNTVDKTPAEIDVLSGAGYDVHMRLLLTNGQISAYADMQYFGTLIESVFYGVSRFNGVPMIVVATVANDKSVTYTLTALATDGDINRIESALINKADQSDIPTAVSELTNDSGFIKTTVVTVDDSGSTMTASMTASAIKAAADAGDRVILRINNIDVPLVHYADLNAVFAVAVDLEHPSIFTASINERGQVISETDQLATQSSIPENALIIDWNNKYSNAYSEAKAAMQAGRDVFLKIPNAENNPTQCALLRANSWDETYIVFGGFTSAYLPGEVFLFTYAHITDGVSNWFKWTTNFYFNPVLLKHLAPPYSNTATYDIGDYVTYGSDSSLTSSVYKCVVAIGSPENWNSAHWVSVTVMEELSNSAGSNLPDTANASVGDFLRLDANKNTIWETVQTWQGGSY